MSRNIKHALAVGIAALEATAHPSLAGSLRVRTDEWTASEPRRRVARHARTNALDSHAIGVRVQPQMVDGQLAVFEVVEVTGALIASDSAELKRPDLWAIQPGDAALLGIAVERSVTWCDAIA